MILHSRSTYFIAVTLAIALIPSVNRSVAQDDNGSSVEKPTEELMTLQQQLKSPRACVRTFLDAIKKEKRDLVYECLGGTERLGVTADAKVETYSTKLNLLIKTYLSEFDIERLSDNPDEPNVPYAIIKNEKLEEVSLVKNPKSLWIFSKSTLDWLENSEVDKLTKSQSKNSEAELPWPIWIQQQFDESWWDTTLILKDYQWVCLGILLLFGLIAGQVVKFLLDYLTKLWFRLTNTDVDDQPRLKLWTPIVSFFHIWIWYFGTQYIDLPPWFLKIALPTLMFFMVVSSVWAAFRLIDLLNNYLAKKARATKSRYDDSLVPLIASALKLIAIAAGILIFVEVFDKDWKTVLGGFGVVGIAVAIAAKDMLGNIFGSITVLADRPFEIGDWIVIDEKVEGTVEHVGIRSSRLRTFHNSQIVVPNSMLTTAIVDNMGRRRYRRYRTMLQVKYSTTVDQLEAFCAAIRQLIDDNVHTKAENAHVYVNDLNECSIDILLYVFFECPSWASELKERHLLISNILKVAEKLGVEFAFPTRTIETESTATGKTPFATPSHSNAVEFGRKIASQINKNQD